MSCNENIFENISGGCCTPPVSNELAIKCSQVKREIEKLAKSTEAQFLIQNKKIAETCIYIKENLSNAIRTLLNDMELSGELDNIITDTVLDQVAAMEIKFNAMIMPEDFGAMRKWRGRRYRGNTSGN